MKCLNHENLIGFREILVHNKEYKKNYYLFLPFGIEVLEFAKQKEILLSKSLRKTIIYQIISGLKELHSREILHRDIKPDNIFLMKNGIVKIGDFSLSRKKIHKTNPTSMV
jgi:serine/threonine protein kinase